MTLTILESNMLFGPFNQDHCFYLEKSELYQKLQHGVQIAEFLLIKIQQQVQNVWIIEAKSSSPRPQTQPAFDAFIAEIADKMRNALLLTLALKLGRHGADAQMLLPADFQTLDLSTTRFKFILVIKNHLDAWLVPLQEALNRCLWALNKSLGSLSPLPVVVLNETLARQHGLIGQEETPSNAWTQS